MSTGVEKKYEDILQDHQTVMVLFGYLSRS